MNEEEKKDEEKKDDQKDPNEGKKYDGGAIPPAKKK